MESLNSFNLVPNLLLFTIRVILTIVIEVGIAILFMFYEKKIFRFIVTVNIITQILLNVSLSIIYFRLGTLAFVIFYILLELLVIVIEAASYLYYRQKHNIQSVTRFRLVIYALAANTASFLLGLILSNWLLTIL